MLLCSWSLMAGLVFTVLPLNVNADSQSVSSMDMDITTAVNLSGRQRMLSQRMVKAYLMLGQGIATDDARTILQKSVDQFEFQLAKLKTFQPTPKVRSTLATLDFEWAKFKPLISATPSKTGAIALYDANEALQNAAHNVTLAYDDVTIEPLDHLVNLAGRERMLSQRTAKFFLYRTWDLYLEPADMEMHLSRAHFTAVLIQIESSPRATTQIKKLVAKIRSEWEPYKEALLISREPEKMRSNSKRVAELSEQLLASTEELVTLIVDQAKKRHN
ncbi:type IV pili methyl-accepting chemotaxis transducer N-terminal domain-containing protein [Sulfurirhabdus autotrophica]|nr:type IV pili methyl-accepting chemotaxis transducer N-terminal domain-containing protein [Sulfurirhabdus autotrophica]